MKEIKLTDRISYLPAVEHPLSADIVLVRGDSGLFVFDVGNCDAATTYLNELHVHKTVILSHFHSDHTARLEDTVFDELYVGNQTFKSVRQGITVTEPVVLKDGIEVRIVPIPATHAKGSLLMVADGVVFTGDATYAMWKDGKVIYNSQLLKGTIDTLKAQPEDKCYLSHDGGVIRQKEAILKLLTGIYAKRTSDSLYIVLNDDEC